MNSALCGNCRSLGSTLFSLGDLESVKTQLMTAQTEGFRLSQKIQDCQTQVCLNTGST